AAERPSNAREAARFRGKPGRRRPVPGRSPPSNRPGKQRFSEGRLTQRRQEAKAQGTVRGRGKDRSKSLTRQVVVPNSRSSCVSAPLRLCVGSTAFSRVKGLGLDRRVADDAIALADGVVEAGQQLGARDGLDRSEEHTSE